MDRFIASLIDSLVVLGIPAALGLLSYALLGEDAGYAVGVVAYLALVFFYAPLMLAFRRGQTWGKQGMNVKVRNHSGEEVGIGRALLRELVVKSALAATGIGPIIDAIVALARNDRRALHDLAVGTEVVKAR